MTKLPIFFTVLIATASAMLACPSTMLKTDSKAISFVPQPKSVEVKEGLALIDSNAYLIADNRFSQVADFIKEEFKASTSIALSGTNFPIQLIYLESAKDEGYRLNTTQTGVTIFAKTPAGIFYGYQTLKQLFPIDFFRANGSVKTIEIPCVNIIDEPRFAWRGLHLDCCRYFHSVEAVKHYIDIMALHKMNTFHWHLTDDQGWRIEIKKYPKLTEIGGFRKQTMKGHFFNKMGYDGTPHGGFYTQEEAKEIVAYAAKRFITIVPEFELPGHAQAALAAYPEFGNTDKKLEVYTTWGVIPHIFNVNDNTIAFFKDVFDEIMEIFPSQYIHIGGDEAPKVEWKNSPEAQARIKKEGLKNEEELQGWIVRQMDEHMAKNNRRILGWDEILDGNPSQSAIVMSWRGEAGGIKASQLGHDVVMAPNTYCYFDYYQKKGTGEPLAIGGFIPIKKVYSFEPCSDKIPQKYHKHIIGTQANIWCEYIKNIEQAIYMAYPRASALSEVQWCEPKNKNYSRFEHSLKKHLLRLAVAGFEVKFDPHSQHTLSYSISGEETIQTFELPASPNGLYQIFFTGNVGNATEIEYVELLYQDTVVDKETHYGYSGKFDQGSMYTLHNDKATNNGEAKMVVKLKGENNKAAQGKIIISTM